jgi:hypothetical protein
MTAMKTFVGIDIAKADVVVASRPDGTTWTATNDPGGIRTTCARLQGMAPALVVLEATGGDETALAAALVAAALPVVVVNPRQVRDFAKATGPLAKTDRLDAVLLALFADRVPPTPRPWSDEALQRLEALMTRRRQWLDMLTAERPRLEHATAPIRRELIRHIRWLERRVAAVDRDLDDTIQKSPVWACERGPPPYGPWHWAGGQSHAPGGSPGTRAAEPATGRGAGWGRAARERQWAAPRQAPRVGRTGAGARRVVHEHVGRHTAQPRHPCVLPPPAPGRQAQTGRARRLHAQTADDPQRDDAHTHDVAAAPSPCERLTSKTVAIVFADVNRVRAGYAIGAAQHDAGAFRDFFEKGAERGFQRQHRQRR